LYAVRFFWINYDSENDLALVKCRL